MRRIRCFGIVLAFLGQMSACSDPPVTERPVDCYTLIENPATCLYADSIDFGTVSIGDTVEAHVDISNVEEGPMRKGFSLNISASQCRQFSWETGTWWLDPLDQERIVVKFRPDAVGRFVCELALSPSSCAPVYMVGVGTADQNPLLSVRNDSPYEARFTVTYIWNDSTHIEERTLRSNAYHPDCSCRVAVVDLPDNATSIELHAMTANGIEPDLWTTVLRQSFPEPVRKCFFLNSGGWSSSSGGACGYYPDCGY